MALTPRLIKLLYCYLVCLFFVIYLVINLSSLLNDAVKLSYFEETYTSGYHLDVTEFSRNEKFKGLTLEEIEKLRQATIAEEKRKDFIQLRNNVLRSSIHVMLAVLLLGIHTLIIRRSRHT